MKNKIISYIMKIISELPVKKILPKEEINLINQFGYSIHLEHLPALMDLYVRDGDLRIVLNVLQGFESNTAALFYKVENNRIINVHTEIIRDRKFAEYVHNKRVELEKIGV